MSNALFLPRELFSPAQPRPRCNRHPPAPGRPVRQRRGRGSRPAERLDPGRGPERPSAAADPARPTPVASTCSSPEIGLSLLTPGSRARAARARSTAPPRPGLNPATACPLKRRACCCSAALHRLPSAVSDSRTLRRSARLLPPASRPAIAHALDQPGQLAPCRARSAAPGRSASRPGGGRKSPAPCCPCG